MIWSAHCAKLLACESSRACLVKCLTYGAIIITTAANIYSFDTMQDPNAIKSALNRQIEKSEDSSYDRQAEKIASAIRG